MCKLGVTEQSRCDKEMPLPLASSQSHTHLPLLFQRLSKHVFSESEFRVSDDWDEDEGQMKRKHAKCVSNQNSQMVTTKLTLFKLAAPFVATKQKEILHLMVSEEKKTRLHT